MKDTHIVVGLGFGDEGKGLVTSSLVASSKHPLVVRFNGGHQAGHTVVREGIRHVFSNFGSGTLQEVPTYWSKYCTVDIQAMEYEYNLLASTGLDPILFLDPECQVITPWDISRGQQMEQYNNHGSCGVGFGAALMRASSHYNVRVRDLAFPKILRAKLQAIASFWGVDHPESDIERFLNDAQRIGSTGLIVAVDFEHIVSLYKTIIFEGAQGILLDMDYGFFPNVTRSNTTGKNALELIREHNLAEPATWYVTRAYQTRHGNGFMSNETLPIPVLQNIENETNKDGGPQGKFRRSILDESLLTYSMDCNHQYEGRDHVTRLAVTCLDQIGPEIHVTDLENDVIPMTPEQLGGALNFRSYEMELFSSPETRIINT